MKERLFSKSCRCRAKLCWFWNGWGMGDAFPGQIELGDYDLLVSSGYDGDGSLPRNWREKLSDYEEVHLVAWSLGVFAAAWNLHGENECFDSVLAINGTERPLGETGIDEAVFRGTIDNWQLEAARKKFYLRVAGSGKLLEQLTLPGEDNVLAEQEELESIYFRAQESVTRPMDFFDRAVIGRNDRIFGLAAQQRYWRGREGVTVTELDLPHYPFEMVDSVEKLVHFGNC